MINRYLWLVLFFFCSMANVSHGGANVDELESEENVADDVGNEIGSYSGVVEADVEMTGYAIINGAVWIDGVQIHRPQSVYVSKKNGKTYRIRWSKSGDVSVTEE